MNNGFTPKTIYYMQKCAASSKVNTVWSHNTECLMWIQKQEYPNRNKRCDTWLKKGNFIKNSLQIIGRNWMKPFWFFSMCVCLWLKSNIQLNLNRYDNQMRLNQYMRFKSGWMFADFFCCLHSIARYINLLKLISFPARENDLMTSSSNFDRKFFLYEILQYLEAI